MPEYIARYGAMRLLGVFDAPEKCEYSRGVRAILRTDRGLEAGEILCDASNAAVGSLKDPGKGSILRAMTAGDEHELSRMHDQERNEFRVCVDSIEKLGLEMQLVDVEHIFGGERIVVYYLADGRVDFRELVRILAGEFQTRIEMRQIGVRDEAKLKADYGDCGNPVCCNNHLVSMPPVSMKMAKMQKATLDPTKISGRCGRLKCCLRFEFETYERLLTEMPSIGARVLTPEGRARVIGHEVLAGQLLVETEERVRKLVDLADVSPAPNEKRPDSTPNSKS